MKEFREQKRKFTSEKRIISYLLIKDDRRQFFLEKTFKMIQL